MYVLQNDFLRQHKISENVSLSSTNLFVDPNILMSRSRTMSVGAVSISELPSTFDELEKTDEIDQEVLFHLLLCTVC